MSICMANPYLVFKIHPSEDLESTLFILFTKSSQISGFPLFLLLLR